MAKRIRRISINLGKGGVKFAEQQGTKDIYKSIVQPALTQLLSVEGVEAVENEILRMTFDGELKFNGHHETVELYRKAQAEWKDFYEKSNKSVETRTEILRSLHKELEEGQQCVIKCAKGYYAGLFTVNGELIMYSTNDIDDADPAYFKNSVQANKVMAILTTCKNFKEQKPSVVVKLDGENSEGIEQLARYLNKNNLRFEYTGYRKESFGSRTMFVRKYVLGNGSAYKLEANYSSHRYTLYFKSKPILNTNAQIEIIKFIDQYCPSLPVNIGKTTPFAEYLKNLKDTPVI